MAVYKVLNDADEVINTINADAAFMQANFSLYEKVVPPEPTEEEVAQDAKSWRDAELLRTDRMAVTPDWPDQDKWLAYRAALRDWPSADSFPRTRPASPDIDESIEE